MDQLLDYIEKYKFALLGTALFHVIFFFYANFTTLKHPYGSPDNDAEILIPLDDMEFDPEIMEMLDLNKQEQTASEEVSNLAADANDQRERSYENFSTQEMDQQVEDEARNLEQQFFDEWAATHDDGGSQGSTADIELDKDKNKTKQNTIDKTNIRTEGSNAFAGEVMVSFNLPNRKAHSLPRPGYTCNSSGTVVIDVKVDQSGSVKSASFNSSLSRGADECMVNKAVEYAKQSRFNFSNSAPGSQSGTITYKFIGK